MRTIYPHLSSGLNKGFNFKCPEGCQLLRKTGACSSRYLVIKARVRIYPPNECPGYDAKQSDGEVPAVLELWGMRSTPLLPLLPGPL